eukprot:3214336-Rhodomonas_salina.4
MSQYRPCPIGPYMSQYQPCPKGPYISQYRASRSCYARVLVPGSRDVLCHYALCEYRTLIGRSFMRLFPVTTMLLVAPNPRSVPDIA